MPVPAYDIAAHTGPSWAIGVSVVSPDTTAVDTAAQVYEDVYAPWLATAGFRLYTAPQVTVVDDSWVFGVHLLHADPDALDVAQRILSDYAGALGRRGIDFNLHRGRVEDLGETDPDDAAVLADVACRAAAAKAVDGAAVALQQQTPGVDTLGLSAALQRLRQAAEQYLDTEHRGERTTELRRALGEAAVDAALVLARTPATAS